MFLSSLLASSLTTLLLHPFDMVRLKQISNKTNFKTTLNNIYYNVNPIQNIAIIKNNFKLINFYRALPISMLSYTATYSIYFPLNAYLKTLSSTNNLNLHTYMIYTLATIPPSIVSMTVCNPLWTIKANQIADNSNLKASIKKIYTTNGLNGFYKGIIFGYVNNINGIISFSLYDIFKDLLKNTTFFNTNNNDDDTKNLIIKSSISSITSKTIATIICYPLLVMRIQQQVNQNSMQQSMQQILTSNIRSTFNGIGCTLAHQLPKNSILLLLLEIFNKIF